MREHAGLAAAVHVAEGSVRLSDRLEQEHRLRSRLLRHVPASNPDAQIKLLYLCLFLIKSRIGLDREATETVMQSVADFL
jgi:hypothetical protein